MRSWEDNKVWTRRKKTHTKLQRKYLNIVMFACQQCNRFDDEWKMCLFQYTVWPNLWYIGDRSWFFLVLDEMCGRQPQKCSTDNCISGEKVR